MRKNKGYTLVEMLIVLAIMAILSGLAVVSVGLIRKAKIQDAITTFDSQLTNLWMTTKATASQQQSMKAEFVLNGTTYELKIVDGAKTVSTTEYEKWDKYVTVKYNGVDCTSKVTIQFDKSTGAVVNGNGAGDYQFYDKTGNLVATIHLDSITGNHYIK